ncbi:hypothetical protein [Oceanobacillus sp. J11TS1]|uniref:hypothetical protein n=1 Tax=Oceanobacillus sp. J11TS1 TaxID=2807191 RepID=UPI001AFEF9BB|nr:hypothetical protein [Oceanobacillus sp. J11TS1]GIO25179.1 hypothetical protein J11TS1_37600 [Oceanobacillus sp. J11TS1]
MNLLKSIMMNPSFLGSIVGVVISSTIAILIYKHGNKIEKENQRNLLLSRKIYLLNLFKFDLKRLKLSINELEIQESVLNHLERVKGYFLLFDDKVLNQKERELLLLWKDLLIQIEYYFLFSAADANIFDEKIKQMNNLLGDTDKLLKEIEKDLKK